MGMLVTKVRGWSGQRRLTEEADLLGLIVIRRDLTGCQPSFQTIERDLDIVVSGQCSSIVLKLNTPFQQRVARFPRRAFLRWVDRHGLDRGSLVSLPAAAHGDNGE